ncbi:MAG: ADP-ribosylglycohydrolase family protein [Pseudomonadota bacterium]
MTPHQRATAALQNLFVADALAMPVHWFYRLHDIETAYPDGIRDFQDAPAHHPSSIMSLHSTAKGGRGGQGSGRQIVGDVILKGRRDRWGKRNGHYHAGMKAGENTLNAHCARVLMRSLAAGGGHWHRDRFLSDYIDFMTADPPPHPDSYAESFHRGFFANLEAGKAPECCAAKTHDTPSIGGLVMIAPVVMAERLRGVALEDVRRHCRELLYLTHPDEALARIMEGHVDLIDALLFRDATDMDGAREHLAEAASATMALDLPGLVASARDDRDVVGGRFSHACYIDGAWPAVLYLAYRYADRPLDGLQANTSLGGDNVHRGAVLGVLFGLIRGRAVAELFVRLTDQDALHREIEALLDA